MKPKLGKWIGLCALAGFIVIAIGVCFIPASSRGPKFWESEQRGRVQQCLYCAYTDLTIAAMRKPDGGGCTSIQGALTWAMAAYSNRPLAWSTCSLNGLTNGLAHPNPDWTKWQGQDTNSSEIAAFCDLPIRGSNGTPTVFLAMTFDNGFIELTNQPQWPSAADWLQEKHGQK